MTDITDRLERLYTDNGTNYIQEAAREIRKLRDEVAVLREPKIDYTVLHGFADKHQISYNELCATVRAALIAPKDS